MKYCSCQLETVYLFTRCGGKWSSAWHGFGLDESIIETDNTEIDTPKIAQVSVRAGKQLTCYNQFKKWPQTFVMLRNRKSDRKDGDCSLKTKKKHWLRLCGDPPVPRRSCHFKKWSNIINGGLGGLTSCSNSPVPPSITPLRWAQPY